MGNGPTKSSGSAERARRFRAPLKLILPTVAALGAGAAIAVGAIPSSDGTITGCYQTVSGNVNSDTGPFTPYGTLRLIDPSNTTATDPLQYSCEQGTEQTITWNQQGPPGPTGPTGAAGKNGANGTNGANGANGQNGAPGSVVVESGPNSDLFMTLTGIGTNAGISGETQDKLDQVSKSDIPLTGFTLQTTHTTTIGSATGGAGAGKVKFATFTVTKPIDGTSPALFKDLVSGAHISKATIFVTRVKNGKRTTVAQYELSLVTLTSITDSGHKSKTEETIEGLYGSIKYGVLGATKNGGTTTVSSGWNQIKNTSSLGVG